MMSLVTAAARAAAIVFGISAPAALAQKLLAGSGLRETLIVHQLSWPGALWLVGLIEAFTYGLAALLLAFLAARSYWRGLFPAKINWLALAAASAAGCVLLSSKNSSLVSPSTKTSASPAVARI